MAKFDIRLFLLTFLLLFGVTVIAHDYGSWRSWVGAASLCAYVVVSKR